MFYKDKIILASTSFRRKRILTEIGYKFEVVHPPLGGDSEELDQSLELPTAVMRVANMKLLSVYAWLGEEKRFDMPIIAADTIVYIDEQVFLKPKSKPEAKNMLETLSGKTHKVLTGTAIKIPNAHQEDGTVLFCEETKVTFCNLTEEEIDEYLDTGEYTDKAGAYAIQGRGALFIEKIEGDYYNVMGLPIAKVAKILNV